MGNRNFNKATRVKVEKAYVMITHTLHGKGGGLGSIIGNDIDIGLIFPDQKNSKIRSLEHLQLPR